MMGVGFLILCYNIYYSFRYSTREISGDSWGVGRTLDWATSSAIPPHYNFAVLPEVKSQDAFLHMKEEKLNYTLKVNSRKSICQATQADRSLCLLPSVLQALDLSLNGTGWA